MEDRFDGPSSRHQPMTRSHTTIEPRMVNSSKNKARNKSIERNGSAVSHMNSPPTPIEAQATLEKILPRPMTSTKRVLWQKILATAFKCAQLLLAQHVINCSNSLYEKYDFLRFYVTMNWLRKLFVL